MAKAGQVPPPVLVTEFYLPDLIELKKASGLKTATPRNGLKASRSESPLIMALASPLTANSRNMLSLGSRQTFTVVVTATHSASLTSAARNRLRSIAPTYRLNFSRLNTRSNSSRTGVEMRILPRSSAASKARRGSESLKSKALTITFVSNTKRKFTTRQEPRTVFVGWHPLLSPCCLLRPLPVSAFFCQMRIP